MGWVRSSVLFVRTLRADALGAYGEQRPTSPAFDRLSASAVVLDSMNQVTIKLKDGMDVVLYGEYISKISGRSAEDAEYDMTPLSKRRHLPSGPSAVSSRVTQQA